MVERDREGFGTSVSRYANMWLLCGYSCIRRYDNVSSDSADALSRTSPPLSFRFYVVTMRHRVVCNVTRESFEIPCADTPDTHT